MKGQASMIDILVLGLFISILIISTIYFGEQQRRAQAARDETFYSKSMLTALMKFNNESYGTLYDNSKNNFTFSEALSWLLCKYSAYQQLQDNNKVRDGLNLTAQSILNVTVRPGFNYIFLVQCGGKLIYTWNNQSDVCAESINKVSFDLELPCDPKEKCGDVYQKPFIGIWPEWQNLPRAPCEYK